jgi:hypothetical protein
MVPRLHHPILLELAETSTALLVSANEELGDSTHVISGKLDLLEDRDAYSLLEPAN